VKTKGRGKAFGNTDIGRKRVKNEDFFAIDPSIGLFVVADGLGGRMSGDKASYEATQVFVESVKKNYGRIQDPVELLRTAFIEASKSTYRINRSEEYYGAMTTFTALFIYGKRYYVVHVGDTRVYLLRYNKFFRQITEDDTQAMALVKKGALSPEDAETHPSRHVLIKALGYREIVTPKLYTGTVVGGDKFLLVSDGAYIYFTDEELKEILRKHSPKDAVELIIKLANSRGGEDNITAVVVEILESESGVIDKIRAFWEVL